MKEDIMKEDIIDSIRGTILKIEGYKNILTDKKDKEDELELCEEYLIDQKIALEHLGEYH